MHLYCPTCRVTVAWAGHAEPGHMPICAKCYTLTVNAAPPYRLAFRTADGYTLYLAADGGSWTDGDQSWDVGHGSWPLDTAGQPLDGVMRLIPYR